MATFQNKRVSQEWFVILRAAEDAGIVFRLNSGQRTMAEQWVLYNDWFRYRKVLAAYPNASAPHIRTPNHALDVDSWNNGESRLQNWLRSEGVAASNTVAGEAWHLELTNAGQKLLYERYRDTHGFPNPARRWIREYDRIQRKRVKTTADKKRLASLKNAMKAERKKFWAKPSKAKIYAALLKRSR